MMDFFDIKAGNPEEGGEQNQLVRVIYHEFKKN